MADKNVDIKFRTKADSRGAKEAKKGIDEVGRSAVSADKELDRLEDSAKDIRTELDKLDGLDPKIRKDTEKFADSLERVAVTGRKVTKEQRETRKANSKAALGFLEVSRAVEDAQYGLRGVLNNLPRIVELFGGGAGLAGVVSLAAVGLFQFGSALFDIEEPVDNASSSLEVIREQFKALQKEIARENVDGFRASIDQVIESLDRQSQSLQRNLGLIQKKRQSELQLAQLSDDLELAQIAAQEATGELSAEQATQSRVGIQLRRLQVEAEEKILKQREKVELIEQESADLSRKRADLLERINNREEELETLLEKRNRLQRLKAAREDAEAEGQRLIDSAGFFNNNGRFGRIKQNEGFRIFGPEREIELEETNERVGILENAIETFRRSEKAAEQRQLDLLEIGGEAVNTLRLIEQTEIQALDLKTKILETKTATQATQEAAKSLSSELSELDQATKTLGERSEADRSLLTRSQEQIRKALDDGKLTVTELSQTQQRLGVFIATTGGASREAIQEVGKLQAIVSQLQSGLREVKAENIRLSQKMKYLNARQ